MSIHTCLDELCIHFQEDAKGKETKGEGTSDTAQEGNAQENRRTASA